MITFSENNVNYSDGQISVASPPAGTLNNGFLPETALARGQTLPAQWLNYLFRTIFRSINRDIITDAAGVGLFAIPDAMIRIEAFDTTNPTRFLVAVGYKGAAGTLHSLVVVANNTLTLGTPTIAGNQPILGGSANVKVVGYSRQSGNL